jgi:hypothetical protein
MKQAIISKQDRMIAFQTPYNRDFVDELKNKIHYTERQWDRDNKVWLVTEAEADKALEITARYFEVVDGRGKSADEVEEAQIEAEIAQIKANQAAILEQQEYIEEIIDRLDTAIDRYSFRSKSAIKGAMARDRALLQHSLDNTKLPLERLTELHIRGMAAALRLIKGGYKPPRGARI